MFVDDIVADDDDEDCEESDDVNDPPLLLLIVLGTSYVKFCITGYRIPGDVFKQKLTTDTMMKKIDTNEIICNQHKHKITVLFFIILLFSSLLTFIIF